jgi:hypothetical protein
MGISVFCTNVIFTNHFIILKNVSFMLKTQKR